MRKLVLAAIAATTLFQVTTLKAAIIQEPDGTIRSVENAPTVIHIPRSGAGGNNREWIISLDAEVGGTGGVGSVTVRLGSATEVAPAISFYYTGGDTFQTSAAGTFPFDTEMEPGRVRATARLRPGTKHLMRVELTTTNLENNTVKHKVFTTPLHDFEKPHAWDRLTLVIAGDAAIKASIRSVSQTLFMVK